MAKDPSGESVPLLADLLRERDGKPRLEEMSPRGTSAGPDDRCVASTLEPSFCSTHYAHWTPNARVCDAMGSRSRP